jgi:hypothetical protein
LHSGGSLDYLEGADIPVDQCASWRWHAGEVGWLVASLWDMSRAGCRGHTSNGEARTQALFVSLAYKPALCWFDLLLWLPEASVPQSFSAAMYALSCPTLDGVCDIGIATARSVAAVHSLRRLVFSIVPLTSSSSSCVACLLVCFVLQMPSTWRSPLQSLFAC